MPSCSYLFGGHFRLLRQGSVRFAANEEGPQAQALALQAQSDVRIDGCLTIAAQVQGLRAQERRASVAVFHSPSRRARRDKCLVSVCLITTAVITMGCVATDSKWGPQHV